MSEKIAKAHILILDDEQDVVDYLVEMLEEAGYSVVASTSPLDKKSLHRPKTDRCLAGIL